MRYGGITSPPFLAVRHRVVALSLSGMGDSGRREAYSRRQHAREVLAVSRAAGLERPILVAHSYGGIVALMAGRPGAGCVARTVLIDTFLFPPGHAKPQIPVAPERVYASREEILDRFRLIPPGQWPDPEIRDYIAAHSIRRTHSGWTWKFDPMAVASLNREDYVSRLYGEPSTPIWYMYGECSEIISPEFASRIAGYCPLAAAPIVIPQSHHHVMIERPLALVAALNAVLA